MAANNPVRFLGSKISLVSNSDIRYEGILYTIDTEKSSVALANVKSFGTEDRRTENACPPSDEVYEYIIFRGSDIKDLTVCEPPAQPQQPPAQPQVQQQQMPAQYQQYQQYGMAYGQQYGYPQYGAPYGHFGGGSGFGMQQYMQYPQAQQQPQAHHQQPQAQQPPQQAHQPPQAQAQKPAASAATGKGAAQEVKADAGPSKAAPAPAQAKKEAPPAQKQPQAAKQDGAAKKAEPQADAKGKESKDAQARKPAGGGRGGATNAAASATAPNPNPNSNPNNAPRGDANKGARRGGGRGGASALAAAPSDPTNLQPFDFEKANSLFDKDKLREEDGPLAPAEAEATPDEEPAYSKDSFFDNISCETLEKQDRANYNAGRVTMDEQRRRDMETFGAVSVNDRNRHRGRGGRRYHSHNYRGGYRNYRQYDSRRNNNNNNNSSNNSSSNNNAGKAPASS